MSKKSSKLTIDECDVGDVCWVVLRHEARPVYCTIDHKHENENAIRVVTTSIGYRTVLVDHAFWDENEAKEFKKTFKKK